MNDPIIKLIIILGTSFAVYDLAQADFLVENYEQAWLFYFDILVVVSTFLYVIMGGFNE